MGQTVWLWSVRWRSSWGGRHWEIFSLWFAPDNPRLTAWLIISWKLEKFCLTGLDWTNLITAHELREGGCQEGGKVWNNTNPFYTKISYNIDSAYLLYEKKIIIGTNCSQLISNTNTDQEKQESSSWKIMTTL